MNSVRESDCSTDNWCH